MIIVQAKTELSDYINGTNWILSLTLFYSNNRAIETDKAISSFKKIWNKDSDEIEYEYAFGRRSDIERGISINVNGTNMANLDANEDIQQIISKLELHENYKLFYGAKLDLDSY